MIKISCVHTGANAHIYGIMEEELRKNIQEPIVINHITDPDIITRISQRLRVGAEDTAEILRMYSFCIESGADIIINMCSSIGAIADAAAALVENAGARLIRIDHRMLEMAAANHRRIGVAATLSTTLAPSCALLRQCAEEQGREIEVVQILADGAFGAGPDALADRLYQAAAPYLDEVDALVLAQNSMHECAPKLRDWTGKEVYTSPVYAAQEAAEIVRQMRA